VLGEPRGRGARRTPTAEARGRAVARAAARAWELSRAKPRRQAFPVLYVYNTGFSVL